MAEVKKTPAKKTTKKAEKPTGKSQEARVKKQVDTPAPELVSSDILDSELKTHDSSDKVSVAKAGKRSEKALKETEEKEAKEERKANASEADAEQKPVQTQKPIRSRLERRSKGYRKSAEQLETGKSYTLAEALELASKTSHVKFDAGVELHVRLGVDPRQADQNLRDTVVLPGGTGKTIRVAVFADADQVAVAKKAGADIAAGEEFLQQLDKGLIDFDMLIATPATMPKLGKYARLLGPKGLMPNPKSGTVSTDVAKAVTEAKAGRVEYRVDSTGIVHVGIGKVSFGGAKLTENAKAILNSLKANKPSGLKGNFVRSIYVTSSMGPSIRVAESEA
jgi:large subunit ribosomal protein L1